MSMNDSDFDTPPLVEPTFISAPIDEFADEFSEQPTELAPVTPIARTAAERALALTANRDKWREQESYRAAALTFAALAQAEAIDRQTAVLERQLAVAERQADLTERLIAENRMGNQLAFYGMTEEQFQPRKPIAPTHDEDGNELPPSVYVQVKRNLGIVAAKPAEAVEAPAAEVAAAASDPELDF